MVAGRLRCRWHSPPVRLDDVGDQCSARIDPLMWARITFLRRTVKLVIALARPGYFHLVAIEFFLAKNANTLILERFPDSKLVLGT